MEDMMKRSHPILLILIIVAFTANACKKNNENDKTVLLILAASGGMTLEQQSAATSANLALTALSSTMLAERMTAYNKALSEQKLIAEIVENGCDPIFAREIYSSNRALKNKRIGSVHLAAITKNITEGTPDTGKCKYEFYGEADGHGYETTQSLIMGCEITRYRPSASIAGSISFGSNTSPCTLEWNGSYSGSNYSGSASFIGSMIYNSYGCFHIDWYALIHHLKTAPPLSLIFDRSCVNITKVFNDMAKYYKYTVVKSGTINVGVSTTYSASDLSSENFSSNIGFNASIDSPDGITYSVLDYNTGTMGADNIVTLENVNVAYSSSINISGIEPGEIPTGCFGNMSLTFSGKVNGSTIDSVFTINL
jgi:hypothetical protein